MCGIMGYVGPQEAPPILLEGLQRLEYRGYDSAGIAVVNGHGLQTRRAEGKLVNLVRMLASEPLHGFTGIGHTRWATHGGPTEQNAHPHRASSVAVVHNGIIENYVALKRRLVAQGHVFASETDTEVIAHLVSRHRDAGLDLATAVRAAVGELQGAYSIVVCDATEPGVLVAARLASPLVLGIGQGECFVASDIPAILQHTREMVFLEDGTMAVLRADAVEVRHVADGSPAPWATRHIAWSPAMAEKGGYKHFMLKEIHEQPGAVADTLRGRISRDRLAVELPELPITREDLEHASHIYVVACGTSWHAGLVGKYLIEDLAGLAVHVELGSELRYRNAPMDDRTWVVAISQSGETADTLAAMRAARARGARVVSICNVIESSIARASEGTLYTHAGPEIGVASTKAFTTQLVALHLLALRFGRLLGRISDDVMAAELEALAQVPGVMEELLADVSPYAAVARAFADARSLLYLGRGILYPLALEGALKLKEISYIHAEGYPAGEMKHGPIALIEESVPTVMLHPRDAHYDKLSSNLQEVKARGGPVLAVITAGDEEASAAADHCLTIPAVHPHVLPLVASLPMQLIAYYVADFKGTDVDQPRNLAKAVTVE